MGSCDLKTGVCESSACSAQAPEEKCGCGGACCGDPVACAMYTWKGAFHAALEEVMVDVLKSKIQKAFGAKINKAADAVMSAMDVKWQAKIMMARAKLELMEKMKEEMLKK
jgi:hypothetical protein